MAPYVAGKGTLKFPLASRSPTGLLERIVMALLATRSRSPVGHPLPVFPAPVVLGQADRARSVAGGDRHFGVEEEDALVDVTAAGEGPQRRRAVQSAVDPGRR